MGLVAQQVSAGYGPVAVLSRLSCQIHAGQVTAVLGPNGSGKSTLLRCLARALAPSAGTVHVDSSDLYRLSPRDAAAKIAYVAQDNPVGFEFTVGELVTLGARVPSSPGQESEPVRQALHDLDLIDKRHSSLLSLSGGERQRAIVARALAQGSRYLLLDEPTAHLDLHHQARLLQRLRQIARHQERGILLVLHDLNLAAAYADTVLLLHEGRIATQGPPSDVFTPAVIQSVYQTNVFIWQNPGSGRPWLLPLPETDKKEALPEGKTGRSVHLLCGGGTGAGIMAALRSAGIHVTAGVLTPSDPDSQMARSLGIPFTSDAPFSPLSSSALRTDAGRRQAAQHLVVTRFPVGPGNLPLLQAAVESAACGQSVLLLAPGDEPFPDFTDGEAARLWDTLRTQARRFDSTDDLIDALLRSP